MIRESIVEFLDDNGYEAVGASDGREALQKLGASSDAPPCLILLDLMMPVMDGRTFRERQLQLPELAAIPVDRFFRLPGRGHGRHRDERGRTPREAFAASRAAPAGASVLHEDRRAQPSVLTS